MLLGKDFIGKMVMSVNDGRRVGMVKDLFVDLEMRSVVGIYLGQEGLFSRTSRCVEQADVVLYGVDAVLIRESGAVVDTDETCSTVWMRRDQINGQLLTTPGGTKIATVDDIILDDEMKIIGFRLSRVFVDGPITTRRTVAREALIGPAEENVIHVDLGVAEKVIVGGAEEAPGEEAPPEKEAPVQETTPVQEAATEVAAEPWPAGDVEPLPGASQGAEELLVKGELPPQEKAPDESAAGCA
jgi:uncharacterized protein YrrD